MFSIYDGDNLESKKLAEIIAQNYSYGLGKGNGMVEDQRNLGIVNKFSGTASVLIELGGINNTELLNRINQNASGMGHNIAKGIYMYIHGKEPPKSNQKFEWPKIQLPWFMFAD